MFDLIIVMLVSMLLFGAIRRTVFNASYNAYRKAQQDHQREKKVGEVRVEKVDKSSQAENISYEEIKE